MTARLTPSQWRDPVWLLTLTWAGRSYRFADRAVDITDADGVVHAYRGGMQAEIDLRAVLGDQVVEDSIPVDGIVFDVSVAAEDRAGRPLIGATAELAAWAEGLTLEGRQVLLVGTVSAAEFGGLGTPVSLDIEPASLDDGALLPAATFAVSPDTWTSPADAALGLSYPLVFGKPGLGTTVPDVSRGGAPALLVNTSGTGTWLVCGAQVAGGTGRLINVTAGDAENVAITNTTDNLGQEVATVAGTGTITVNDGDVYWFDWSTTDGGIRQDDGTAAAIGYGDVCRWLLRRSTVQVDTGRWRAVASSLNGYRAGFYVDEPVSPMALVLELLERLPVVVSTGPGGVGATLYRLDAGTTDAVAHLEEGRNVDPDGEGLVTVERAEIVNEVRVSFGPRADDAEMHHSLAVTGDDVPAGASDVSRVPACVASQGLHGRRAEALDLPRTYDESTAARVALDIVRQRAHAPRLTSWVDRTGRLGALERGDVVTLTSARLAYTSQVAHVRGVRPRDRVLDVVVYPSLARDGRA